MQLVDPDAFFQCNPMAYPAHFRQPVRSARLLLLAVAAVGFTTSAMGQTAPLNGWQQTFSDEFERTTLDTARWNVANYAAPNNGEAQYYSPANISILSGGLRITSERRNIGGRVYASGNITTQGKFSQAYGRFEMRAKLPGTQGIWPAFWMLRNSGGWPPEIDIMELLGHQPSTMYFTNHWGVYPTTHTWDTKSFTGPNFTSDYHTFAVEWAPNRLELYVDGVKRATNTSNVPTEPFYMILNTAVGGQWPGYPDASTVFPQYFDAKYVRAYSRTLFSPGFENYGPANNTTLDGWSRFGGTGVNTTVFRTGGNSAKLSSVSTPIGGVAGVFQDTPARPGDLWRATAWWLIPTAEPLTGQNFCTTNIEWIDGAGAIISIVSAPAGSASSARDTWLPSMIEGIAPVNTVSARLVLKFTRPASAAGSSYVDDVDLQRLAVNTRMDDRGTAGTSSLAGWTPFGTAAASLSFPRSGVTAVKLSGRNIAGGSTSGVFQDFAVRAGQVWQGSAWWLAPSAEPLAGGNSTQMNIEWLDSGKRNLATSAVPALTAASPRDDFVSASLTAVAPAGAVWARLALNYNQVGLASGAAYVEDAALRPLLANATFEDLGPTENTPLYGWSGFGNRAGDATLVRGGANAAKIYGTFTSATGFSQPSGLSQVFIASPNQRWKASAYFAHVATDRLMGGNAASIVLEWLNSAGNVIRADATQALTVDSPTGVYIQSTVDAAAPFGTTRGRLTLLFTQSGFSSGAALVDDVMLEPQSPCGGPIALDATAVCPCSIADVVSGGGVAPGDGVVDGSDFIAFINAFASGDMLADLPSADGTQAADGVVDGGDFIAFINAFSMGC